jgi:hypothetical protein
MPFAERRQVILWSVRGITDREVVCEIEKHPGGYRLLVEHGGEAMVDEAHDSVEDARRKAEVFREKMKEMGWTE